MNASLNALSWDDLRTVKAIGEHGGLGAAATALGVNHSTVVRRLSAIEATLGVTLFDRRRSGYAPTQAGLEIIELGRRIEGDVLTVTSRITGHMRGHSGLLKVATSDAILCDLMTPIIVEFQDENPDIRIEVAAGNAYLNLARAEADIAFRSTTNPPENLFGRKMTNIGWAIYGSRSRFKTPYVEDPYRERWVSYHGSLFGLRAFELVQERVPSENVVYRTDSVLGVAAAICAGSGIGYLPCIHGDLVPGLVRISPVEAAICCGLWMLTHPDIRKSDRVDAFMAHCAKGIAKRRRSIEGVDGALDPAAKRD